ncbi:MAG: hypothetical protein RLZZ367_1204 [Bacteroidota bacterium]|jgi:uncharacterized protein YigE (DUF2233 family)
MSKKSLLLIAVFCINMVHAQTHSRGKLVWKANVYDIYIVCADSLSLSRFSILQNPQHLRHRDIVSRYTLPDSNVLLINAGISGISCMPEGWLVADGTQLGALNLKDGNANFYLKPNGVLLIADGKAVISESSNAASYKNVRIAVQSGPLLLNNSVYNPQIKPGSSNKNIRCGVGLYYKNGVPWLVFATSVNAVNFYDFACLFKERYNCKNALCLESAGCAMYAPYIGRANATDDFVICNYILYKEQ